MRFRPFLLAGFALLSAVVAVSCGGSSDSSTSSSGDQNARTTFIKQANDICKAGSARINTKAKVVFKTGNSMSELARRRLLVHTAIAPVFEQEIREIHAVGPPPTGAREVEAILSAMQRLVDELKKNPLSRGPYPYRGIEDLATGYGLSDCGHP